MNEFHRVVRFAVVSGTGLVLDFAVFLALTGAGFSAFTANAVSGTCAVTFVYFASVRRIFSYAGRFLVRLFAAYLVYQAVGVTAASLAVAFLSAHLVAPVVAKLLILPVTFSCNYLFMSLLTRRGREQGVRPPPAAAGARALQQAKEGTHP
ncbi:MAG: GtrA family protein [Gemmatimonadetes bacterium]|nr:GtrA family protein [Gemmatimonadota bacterium]